jgi:hypothetical protein
MNSLNSSIVGIKQVVALLETSPDGSEEDEVIYAENRNTSLHDT